MSFCRNTFQQFSMFDPLNNLTERERKILKNTWAEEFGNKIFPLINEERFSVIYSDNPASRPNNPVNVYFSLLMLKEIFTQSDEEALHSLLFDIRYQYALHTTSFEEQPVSKNSLTNFRTAIYKYNEEHNVDLIQEEIENHAKAFSKLLNINGETIRMDSVMISSSCKRLSRLEIIYSCTERLITEISDVKPELLPEKFKVYLEEGHRNDTIYRSKGKTVENKLRTVTADAVELFYLCKLEGLDTSDDFKTLSRMLNEQIEIKGGSVDIKPAKEISPESLQNPTDPDATYRKKGDKESIGYVANIVESFDDKSKIIMHYDLKKNTYSDQKFSEDTIGKLDTQGKVTALVDGAYYSEDISKKAAVKNITMVPTNLVGRSQNSEKSGYEKFDIDEAEHIVKRCQAGYTPVDSRYKKEVYRAHFESKNCDSCPHRAICPVSKQKKSYLLEVCETKLHRSKLIAQMGTQEYKKIANKRAGIEGIPSVLRRRYNVDHLPVRGLVRSKVWIGLKVSAINCKRLIKGLINKPSDTLLNQISNHLLQLFGYQRTFFPEYAA